ncbi:O-acetyl-ADP-ribose deacetylase [Planctomonas psychrotolerans]|uniref:O-acetyl-ADP-ribose deacetylase n=1 Tax=Planctomonas psychrotolerans TaxID=2528712 RepID=UPI00123948E8|nr:O-acetyl-ADP-ribose deacetylase [Planctomonas psychrotolerans]
MTSIEITRGDITGQDVDAIVNAANNSLLGGGGVDGAIHRAGGPDILDECRRLRATEFPDGLPTGSAAATTAGRLAARMVIHTVGPVWSEREDRSGLLASAYRESLRVALDRGAASIAFPAISAGVYGWPMDDAARIAITTIRDELACIPTGSIELVRFVLFSEQARSAFASAADAAPAS